MNRGLPTRRLTLSEAFLVRDPRDTWDRSAFQTMLECFAYTEPEERQQFRADARQLTDDQFFSTRYWKIVASFALQRVLATMGGCKLCLYRGPLVVRPTSNSFRGEEHTHGDSLELLCELCLLERNGNATDEQRAEILHRRKQAWVKRNTLARRDNDQDIGFIRAFPGK